MSPSPHRPPWGLKQTGLSSVSLSISKAVVPSVVVSPETEPMVVPSSELVESSPGVDVTVAPDDVLAPAELLPRCVVEAPPSPLGRTIAGPQATAKPVNNGNAAQRTRRF